MYKENIDEKIISDKMANNVLYSSKIFKNDNDDTITIKIKGEKNE